ncbi:MAG: AbrB/MazE/SpoVT family DNA-binding domain-containing protein [Sulfolobales archaeon]|jgi:phosphate uptake regulator|nr:AbrB/MazE/SpoVT family DNA-binding domain-containing protein [Sulfolobales archaeon]
MDLRKVQKFGKSTLMISLPAEWVKSVNLKPGTSVYIDVDEDGGLKVYPPTYNPQGTKHEIQIKISENTDPDLLERVVRSFYVLGFDRIVIKNEGGIIPNEAMRKLREVSRSLIGLEMIANDLQNVEIRSYIDPTKHNFNVILGQLVNTLKLMVDYLSHGLKSGSRKFIEEILELEKEADRLYFLGLRQLILAQTNKSLAYIIGVPSVQIIGNRIIIKSLEEVADEISEAANMLLGLPPEGFNYLKDFYPTFLSVKEKMDTLLNQILRLRGDWNYRAANELMEELRVLRKSLMLELENLQAQLMNDNRRNKYGPKIVGFMLRFYSAIRNLEPIAEIAMNRSLENLKEVDLK